MGVARARRSLPAHARTRRRDRMATPDAAARPSCSPPTPGHGAPCVLGRRRRLLSPVEAPVRGDGAQGGALEGARSKGHMRGLDGAHDNPERRRSPASSTIARHSSATSRLHTRAHAHLSRDQGSARMGPCACAGAAGGPGKRDVARSRRGRACAVSRPSRRIRCWARSVEEDAIVPPRIRGRLRSQAVSASRAHAQIGDAELPRRRGPTSAGKAHLRQSGRRGV